MRSSKPPAIWRLVLLVLLGPEVSAQDFEFQELVSGEVRTLIDFRAGDLDGDGVVDLITSGADAVAPGPPEGVAWHRNVGGGLLVQPQLVFPAPGLAQWWRVFLEDVDGDGDLDIVGTAGGNPGAIRWQENLGSGAFGPAVLIGSHVGAYDAAVVDLDLDGENDVAVGGSGGVVWFPGLGGGTFGPAVSASTGFYRRLRSGDVDGDGDVDLIAGDADLVWLENDGTGAFTPGSTLDSTGAFVDFEFVDVDGDGDGDVVAVNDTGGQVRWYENDGAGVFSSVLIDLVSRPNEIAAADMDGDGDIDLVSTSNAATGISGFFWYENQDGEGAFDTNLVTSTALFGRLEVADVDGDGQPDVVTFVAGGFGTLTWHRNLGGLFAGGYGAVLTYGSARAYGASGDLDGDGDLDIVSDVGGNGLAWFENIGGEVGFTSATLLPATTVAQRLRLGDLDDDGDLDVLAAGPLPGPNDSAITWLENDGSASFAGHEFLVLDLTSSGMGDLELTDINLDGQLDIVAKGDGTGSIGLAWYRNAGTGDASLDLEVAIDTTQGPVDELELGDIDADGDVDVATERLGFIRTHENLDGLGGSWTSADVVVDTDVLPFGEPFSDGFQLADLDDDGLQDILVAAGVGQSGKQLRWYRNAGNVASFDPGLAVVTFFSSIDRWSFLAEDIDADGLTDILTSGRHTAAPTNVQARLNDGGSPLAWAPLALEPPAMHLWALADLDGDGDGDLIGTQGGSAGVDLQWFANTFADDMTWTDLGGGTVGINGVPTLAMSGPLTPASTLTLDLVSGAASSLALIFISFTSTPTPFLGGTLHAFPYDELIVLGTDPAGEIHGAVVFPPGVPPGTMLWFQVGLADASVPIYAASLSNGVKGTVP